MSIEKICIEYIEGIFSLGTDLNTSREISVMPIFEPPYLTRFDSSQAFMCGPIVAIVKEVIIKEKAKY